MTAFHRGRATEKQASTQLFQKKTPVWVYFFVITRSLTDHQCAHVISPIVNSAQTITLSSIAYSPAPLTSGAKLRQVRNGFCLPRFHFPLWLCWSRLLSTCLFFQCRSEVLRWLLLNLLYCIRYIDPLHVQ